MTFPKFLPISTVLVSILLGLTSLYGGNKLLHADAKIENLDSEWSEDARLAEHSLLLDIAVGPGQVVAVGQRGHVLLSNDQGVNWTQILVPTRSMLNAIAFADDRHSWIVGHDASILHSADSGVTWERQNYNSQDDRPLFDVWFEGSNRGLAVGAYGFAIETSDGGKHWSQVPIVDEDQHLYAIAEGPNKNIYVVGEFGSIFESQDLGYSWHTVNSPYQGTFFGAVVLSDGSLLVFGLRGTLFHLRSNKRNWEKIETGTNASLFHGVERSNGDIVIVGSAGTVLVGQMGEQSFRLMTRADRKAMVSIAAVTNDHLIAVGESGVKSLKAPFEVMSKLAVY